MKKNVLIMLGIFGILLLGCAPADTSPAPVTTSEMGTLEPALASRIQSLVDESQVPSLAASLLVGQDLVWAHGYGGQSDLSTVYMAGSIDKVFTATAILQLYERGLVDLNDDINEYLPFSVRHPEAPDLPITIRMLLVHQSGLPHDLPGSRYTDTDGPMLRWLFSNRGNQLPDLYRSIFPLDPDDHLAEVFSPDSVYGSDFWVSLPGAGYQYSNAGFQLLGKYIIESASGQPYPQYVRENIFEPLGMNQSSFEAGDFPPAQLAIPYENFEEQGYSDLPLTSMAASGRLRTTVPDLSRFLLAHMNQGELEGTRILEPDSVALMHERLVPLTGFDFPGLELHGTGLGWVLWGDGRGGHGGATPGNFALVIYGETEAGPYGTVIMMTNGCSQTECDFHWFDAYFVTLREWLLDEGSRIARQGPS